MQHYICYLNTQTEMTNKCFQFSPKGKFGVNKVTPTIDNVAFGALVVHHIHTVLNHQCGIGCQFGNDRVLKLSVPQMPPFIQKISEQERYNLHWGEVGRPKSRHPRCMKHSGYHRL